MTAETIAAPRQWPAGKEPLSHILRELSDEGRTEAVTLGEIIHRLGPRSFGALLFFFAIPNVLPLPPGSSTILGLPLLLLAPQVALGVGEPWLPRKLDDHAFKPSDLRRFFGRIIPTLEKVEFLSKPRLTWMFGRVGDRVMGLLCTLLAIVLILPIPLGNLAPAFCIGAFGLALFQRDGIIALAGYGLFAVSTGLLWAGAKVGIALVTKAIETFAP
jgi:hypothetical protein